MRKSIDPVLRPHVAGALVAAHRRGRLWRLLVVRALYRPSLDEEALAVQTFLGSRA